jgi:hypothetical protein
MPFFNRKHELALLDDIYQRPNGDLFVLYGRRRVGKTVLLNHWLAARRHRALFWTADQTSAASQIRAFSQTLQKFKNPNQALPPDFTYGTWEIALTELAGMAERERFVTILDEFTYLIESDPTVPSVLQRLWDHRLKQTHLLLALTGSHAGMIEREILAYRSPLYNRATQSLHLQPLSYGTLAAFFPHYSAEDRVAIYACVGGVPQYLELFKPNQSLNENLEALLSNRVMMDDAGVLLRDQLSEPRNYIAIVSAIASGFTRTTEIATMSGLENSNVSKYLSVLQHLGIVIRDVPATESRPEHSKQGRYRIVDPYLRFYFRFIVSQRTNLERGLKQQAWDNVRQHLFEFIGTHTFEELCREWVARQGDAGKLPFAPQRVGSFWSRKGPQVDIVAINEDAHAILLGECKWTKEPVGRSVVQELLEKTPQVVPGDLENWKVYYAFFSKSGFTDEAKKLGRTANCLWISLEQMDRDLREV